MGAKEIEQDLLELQEEADRTRFVKLDPIFGVTDFLPSEVCSIVEPCKVMKRLF